MGNNPQPNRRFGAVRQRRRGQGLVELALILPFMLVLTLGIVDVGLLISDRYNILYSTRESARVGAANACFRDDSSVVARVAAVLRNKPVADIGPITIFDAQPTGSYTSFMRYRITAMSPALVYYTDTASNWPYTARWNDPDYNNPKRANWLGVTTVYTHHAITLVGQALWGTSQRGSETTIMRIEPPEKADGSTDCQA